MRARQLHWRVADPIELKLLPSVNSSFESTNYLGYTIFNTLNVSDIIYSQGMNREESVLKTWMKEQQQQMR